METRVFDRYEAPKDWRTIFGANDKYLRSIEKNYGVTVVFRDGDLKMMGEPEDLEKIRDLATHMKLSSLCALGQSAPNPVLSTLQYFGDEYLAHINDKKCPSGVCKSLLQYEIIADKCKGCTLCARKCPVSAISGTVKEPHVIDTDKCIKCGVCISNCKFGAIIRK